MLYIARTLGAERDVLFSARGVLVRTLGDPRRHSYYAWTGPRALKGILDACGVRSLTAPLVARCASRDVWPALSGGGTAPAQLAWLIPHPLGVEVRFRSVGEATLATPRAIDVAGPLALPQAWEPPTRATRS